MISQIVHGGLRRVFSEYADVVYGGKIQIGNHEKLFLTLKFVHIVDAAVTVPSYDKIYKTITEEIENCDARKPVLVSWLTPEDRLIAAETTPPAIETIKDVAEMVEFHYPEAKLDFFDHHQETDKKSTAKSLTPQKRKS